MMPADLTREEIAHWRDFIVNLDPPDDVDVLLRIMDAARRSLDEPTRLAQARAEGYRGGIEAAAKWHSDQAAELERRITSREGRFVSGMDRTARIHRSDAAAIRALTPPPAEPVQPDHVTALEAENAALREGLGAYPNPSKYHGVRGFEEQRFFADYDTFRSRARALLQGSSDAG